MAVDCELRRATHLREGSLQRRLGLGRQLEVAHRTARRADQMMMVVIGERFGEFEAGVVVVGDDASDRSDLFEDCQVPVHTRLGEIRIELQDVEDRHRAIRRMEGRDDLLATRRVAMVARAEQRCDIVVEEISAHGIDPSGSGND